MRYCYGSLLQHSISPQSLAARYVGYFKRLSPKGSKLPSIITGNSLESSFNPKED